MIRYKQYGFSGAIAKPYGIKGLGVILYKVIKGAEKPFIKA